MCHCYSGKSLASELRFMKRYTNGNEVVCFIMLMCHINHRKEIHIQGDSEGTCQNKKNIFVYYTNSRTQKFISPSSTVGIQLHVSSLYVSHLQVVI